MQKQKDKPKKELTPEQLEKRMQMHMRHLEQILTRKGIFPKKKPN